MAFKAGTDRARDIDETLLVDYLLEGSLRRRPTSLRASLDRSPRN
jgi:TolB-like protein